MSKKRMSKKTFTKVAVKWILVFAIIDLQLSYLLAFLGRVEIAEELSSTVATAIIGVMLGYFLKSFFETREEEKNKLAQEWRNEPPKGGEDL